MVDHADEAQGWFHLHEILMSLATKSGATITYVVISRTPIAECFVQQEEEKETYPLSNISEVTIPSLTTERAYQLVALLCPLLDSRTAARIGELSHNLVGEIVSLSRMPNSTLSKLVPHAESTMEDDQSSMEKAVLTSLVRYDREFLHHLGPLFAANCPFTDQVGRLLSRFILHVNKRTQPSKHKRE